MKTSNRLFLLLPCIGLLLAISCKKEDHSPTPPPVVVPKVKTVTAGNDIRNFFYDSKGRVIKIGYALYGRGEYAYTDTGIVVSFYDTLNQFQYKQVYKIGADGRALGYINPALFNDQLSYTYTSGGQLLTGTELRTLPGQPVYRWQTQYYYTNSNLDSSIVTLTADGSFGGGSALYYDSYYTDKPNTLGNDNYGQAFLGVSSKNPVKDARDIGHDNLGNYPATNYVYEYDSLNRITKSTEYEGNSGFAPIMYTYY